MLNVNNCLSIHQPLLSVGQLAPESRQSIQCMRATQYVCPRGRKLLLILKLSNDNSNTKKKKTTNHNNKLENKNFGIQLLLSSLSLSHFSAPHTHSLSHSFSVFVMGYTKTCDFIHQFQRIANYKISIISMPILFLLTFIFKYRVFVVYFPLLRPFDCKVLVSLCFMQSTVMIIYICHCVLIPCT